MALPPLEYVLEQIEVSRNELLHYPPENVDWYERATKTARRLVPWLIRLAPRLREHLDGVMNSPLDVRKGIADLWAIVDQHESFNEIPRVGAIRSKMSDALRDETQLLVGAGGAVLSKLIESFLIESSDDWSLESNGASDYPDLFLRSDDYSFLPTFTRKGDNKVFGAAIKGKSKRPVRIPDGLEIKTCKGTLAVDCHHAHVGLHLVVTFNKHKNYETKDVLVGFMRKESYRITKPSTPTTTLKASFNGAHFVSLLSSSSAPSE